MFPDGCTRFFKFYCKDVLASVLVHKHAFLVVFYKTWCICHYYSAVLSFALYKFFCESFLTVDLLIDNPNLWFCVTALRKIQYPAMYQAANFTNSFILMPVNTRMLWWRIFGWVKILLHYSSSVLSISVLLGIDLLQ